MWLSSMGWKSFHGINWNDRSCQAEAVLLKLTRYAPTDNDLTAARFDSPSLNKLQLKSKQLLSSDKLKVVFRGNLSKAQNGDGGH